MKTVCTWCPTLQLVPCGPVEILPLITLRLQIEVHLRAVSGQDFPTVEVTYRGRLVPDELLRISDGQLILPVRSILLTLSYPLPPPK